MAHEATEYEGQAVFSNLHPLSQASGTVTLPLPPQRGEGDVRFEMEIYARFMRHLRSVPSSRMEIKILSAIQFTSDMMDTSDALVAKTLVDLGLRAPRRAFPVTFLDFVDKITMRANKDLGTPPPSVIALKNHWNRTGEDRFAGIEGTAFATYNANIYAEV